MTASDIPLLLIVFRRPDKTRQLIEALAKVKPTQVYILADGPRPGLPEEARLCAEARAIATDIPWECTIHTHFKDTNIGLTKNIDEGITWFFNEVEAGIIFEDDCIPDPTFFSFCAELLEYYKDDTNIMHISGNNFQNGKTYGDGSYYFSHYSHSWGWATWRRAWQQYHVAVDNFPTYDKENRINELPFSRAAKKFWMKHLRNGSHWDGLWLYTTWYSKGLCILPNQNLVTNIGYGEGATHTKTLTAQANVANKPLYTINHPTQMVVSQEADDYTFKALFYVPLHQKILLKLRGIISKIL